MKLIIDTTKEIDKKLSMEKIELGFKNKAETVMHILGNYYGIKQKRKNDNGKTKR